MSTPATSGNFKKIQFGDNLRVQQIDPTTVRVDATGGGAVSGGTGGDANYVYTQFSPTSIWSVVHGLGKFPAVEVVDSGGTELLPNVTYDDVNTVTIKFGSATSGTAYLN